MKRISILTSLSSLIAILASATTLSVKPAQASLIGDTVNLQSTVLNDSAVVVDPGIEFTAFGNAGANLNVDVFDESFDIILNTVGIDLIGAQTNWLLSDLDWVDSPGYCYWC